MIVTIMNCSFSVFDVDRRIQWNTLWFLQWWACNFEMTVHFLISILHNIPLYAARMCTDVWDLVYAANFQYYWAFPFKFTKKSVCLQEGVKWSGLLLLLLVHPIAFCCCCLYIKGEATEGLRCAHAVGQGLRSRNVNGEFPIGGYCPIPVPVGANFPRPHPREGSWGALLLHPHPRSRI